MNLHRNPDDDFAEAMAAAAERIEDLLVAEKPPPAGDERCKCGERKLAGLPLCGACKVRADWKKRDAQEAVTRQRAMRAMRRPHRS